MQSETLITEDSDLALVHAGKGGDRAAFEELVKRYDQRLFRIAQNITHNREDAEEAVQESFLKAFQNLVHFQERSQFSTWLIRIAVNESFMKLRKKHARSALSTISIDDDIQTEDGALPREIVDWTAGPEELYRTSELREILIKALQALRPSLRVVFVLRDIEELSVSETADALGLTSAVKARLLRARLQLRERLNKYFRTTAGLAHTALRDPIHMVKTTAL